MPLFSNSFGAFNIKKLIKERGCAIIHRITRNNRNLNYLPRITHGFKRKLDLTVVAITPKAGTLMR